MNSVIWILIVQLITFAGSVVFVGVEFYKRNIVKAVVSFVIAAATFSSFYWMNDVPTPYIERENDYSAIVLSTDEPMNIEYKISTNGDSSDEWIKYERPFKLEQNAIIYARAKTLWVKSEQIFRDVYVADNGLIYFSGAEKPGDTVVSIKASYNYKDAIVGENASASNYYVGYEIKKSDIKVIGTDLNGNEKEITEFTYSPRVLEPGKNTIEIEYVIADDISVKSNLYVNGEVPTMIKLDAKFVGGNIYLDTVLDNNDFVVKGTYEDGTINEITGYAIFTAKLKEGENEITITKDGLSDVVDIIAIDKETITENESEPNDEIQSANEIEVNVKYSGTLEENSEGYGDVDYYKLRLTNKGKIIIKLTHPKIDENEIFCEASLMSQNEDVRVEMRTNAKDVETISSPVRVTPGIYYIKVSSCYNFDEKYTITILFDEENDSYESEPNDDLDSQAMIISLDKEYTGNITSESDVDYYKFSLKEKRKVWIDFSHDKTSVNHTLWKVSLFGDSDGSLLDIYSTGENAKITSDSVRLPAGNYYIKVDHDYWSDIDYTFCICSKKEGKNTENEDNGDYGLATTIAVGSSVVGNIQSEEDVDFYKFNLKNATSIKVTFTHDQVDSNNTFWKFELYGVDSGDAISNNEDVTTIGISGNSAKNISSKWDSLSAGTYYLKVYSYNYNNDDYKITLSN